MHHRLYGHSRTYRQTHRENKQQQTQTDREKRTRGDRNEETDKRKITIMKRTLKEKVWVV